MNIFDKVKYHTEGDFSKDVSPQQAYVPTGYFIAWCAISGLLSVETLEQFQSDLVALLGRTVPPSDLYRKFGGVFSDANLNITGSKFTNSYFDFENGLYLDDFIEILATDVPSVFHVEDNWTNFDILCVRVDQRFQSWKQTYS